ncbi:MAG: hypothetical protein U5K38_08445 [Woeseiaceae bacterium]|nr:hypothetical protein [Woeseiaceae bacterium]
MLLLKDGHCLRDHALGHVPDSRCRKGAAVRRLSLLTLVEMVDADLRHHVFARIAKDSLMLRGNAGTHEAHQ